MNYEFIKSIETINSGGNIMLDIIHLKSGQILVISDECVCKYNDQVAFFDGKEPDIDGCIELFDYRQMENMI